MVIKKTGKKKYPLYVKSKKGHGFYVPAQQNFKKDFVKHHGCSLVGFYIAMYFIGKHRTMSWLLKWSKNHLKIESKIPLKQVYKGIKKLVPNANITYKKKMTSNELTSALAKGYLVLLETKDPTHTNPLMWDDSKKCVRNFSHGGKKKVSVAGMVKKQSKSDTYRGCVIIRP